MYSLNILSLLLILVAFFVFYNEFNKNLNIAEMILLAISFIAILRAAYNYSQIDIKTNNNNNKNEGFSSNNKPHRRHNRNNRHSRYNNDTFKDINNNDMIINSEDSDEYFDSDNTELRNDDDMNSEDFNNTNQIKNISNINKISNDAVDTVDNLLGININNTELFDNIPNTTLPTPTPSSLSSSQQQLNRDEIKSVFNPQILIGKNSKTNNGFGNTEKQSKWNSVFSGSEFYDDNKCKPPTYTDRKKCGQYNDNDNNSMEEDKDGNLIVKDYKDFKTWVPGYTYLPPSNWDVPQKRPPVCLAPSPNSIKLTGLVDRGLPMNVLELTPYGQVADTEDSVELTNVGSLLPKFRYEEQPFSKPYI
jgi:hypothetical protein